MKNNRLVDFIHQEENVLYSDIDSLAFTLLLKGSTIQSMDKDSSTFGILKYNVLIISNGIHMNHTYHMIQNIKYDYLLQYIPLRLYMYKFNNNYFVLSNPNEQYQYIGSGKFTTPISFNIKYSNIDELHRVIGWEYK